MASFTRQLNKYGFKKVRGDALEFSHATFKRGDKKNIKTTKKIEKMPKGNLKEEYEKLMKEKLKLEKNIKVLAKENQTLHKNNGGLFVQLNLEREEFKTDLSSMMTLFFKSVRQLNPELINIIKNLLMKNKILTDTEKDLLINSKEFLALIPLITEKIIEDKNTKNQFFNNLIDLFYNNFNNFKKIKTTISRELERIKLIGKGEEKLEIFQKSYELNSSESNYRVNSKISESSDVYYRKLLEKGFGSKQERNKSKKAIKNQGRMIANSEKQKNHSMNNDKISKSL